jgi:hypothetical protein
MLRTRCHVSLGIICLALIIQQGVANYSQARKNAARFQKQFDAQLSKFLSSSSSSADDNDNDLVWCEASHN